MRKKRRGVRNNMSSHCKNVHNLRHMGSEVSLLHPWGAAGISHIWEKWQIISTDDQRSLSLCRLKRKIEKIKQGMKCNYHKWLCYSFPTWHLMPPCSSEHLFPTFWYKNEQQLRRCKIPTTRLLSAAFWELDPASSGCLRGRWPKRWAGRLTEC